jgi:hypothetical protein
MMLERKLKTAKKIARQKLTGAPGLRDDFPKFCNHVISMLIERNSPTHSTFLLDDDDPENKFIKWDSRHGPEIQTINELNDSGRYPQP